MTTSSSENPPAGPSAGSRTLRKITTELMKSSAWSTSALMWTYDGWGGWYDHVPPPKVDSRGYGFRVPALLVSPYAKSGEVNHTVLDYTAMLQFIETNWKLAPLSSRDKQSAGLGSAFDFTAAPRPANSLPWTWPAPEVKAATHSPTPVIYSVYGLAAALAIAIVALAARRGPIPVSVTRAAVVARSSLESVRERTVRLVRGSRYLVAWPAPSPALLVRDDTEGPAPVRPGAGLTSGPPMTACTQPGCTGSILDDYCDICGSPASTPTAAAQPDLTAVPPMTAMHAARVYRHDPRRLLRHLRQPSEHPARHSRSNSGCSGITPTAVRPGPMPVLAQADAESAVAAVPANLADAESSTDAIPAHVNTKPAPEAEPVTATQAHTDAEAGLRRLPMPTPSRHPNHNRSPQPRPTPTPSWPKQSRCSRAQADTDTEAEPVTDRPSRDRHRR